MSEAYKKVIQLVYDAEFDETETLFEIAKQNPQAVVNAHAKLKARSNNAKISRVIDAMVDGGKTKMQCVLEVKRTTGWTFKQAEKKVMLSCPFFEEISAINNGK